MAVAGQIHHEGSKILACGAVQLCRPDSLHVLPSQHLLRLGERTKRRSPRHTDPLTATDVFSPPLWSSTTCQQLAFRTLPHQH